MVGNKKTRLQIANDLEVAALFRSISRLYQIEPASVHRVSDVLIILQAFLGEQESKEFSLWLWELLRCVETKQPFVDRPILHDQSERRTRSAEPAPPHSSGAPRYQIP
jgi:hypothetical protein